MLDEAQQGYNALLDLIPAIEVYVVRAADRIANVLLELIQGFVKFAQEESFFGSHRIKHHDRIDMAVGHAEDEISLVDQICRQHPTALAGDVDPEFFKRLYSVSTGRLALHRPKPRRYH